MLSVSWCFAFCLPIWILSCFIYTTSIILLGSRFDEFGLLERWAQKKENETYGCRCAWSIKGVDQILVGLTLRWERERERVGGLFYYFILNTTPLNWSLMMGSLPPKQVIDSDSWFPCDTIISDYHIPCWSNLAYCICLMLLKFWTVLIKASLQSWFGGPLLY